METAPPKRILIVDDSPLICQVLTQLISADPALTVAGIARNGQEAVQMVPRIKPDLVVMDIVMPLMNGLEATKQIMAYSPVPIIIVASSVIEKGQDLAFQALSYGALDVCEKKDIRGVLNGGAPTIDLAERLKVLASVKVITHPLAKFERMQHRRQPESSAAAEKPQIVALVASTGGPQALLSVLKELPKEFPCALVVVQHISAGFTQGLVDWLGRECAIQVTLAADGDTLRPGVVAVAPTGFQMRVDRSGRVRLTDEMPCHGHKPSGSILFESIAASYGSRAIGIILTGMGADGAEGLVKLHAAGGKVIAQDEKTSIVFGMPKAAIDLHVTDWVLPLGEIAGQLLKNDRSFCWDGSMKMVESTEFQAVVFRVGTGLFALPVSDVREVRRYELLTVVPESSPHAAGILHLRGRAIAVIDVARRLGKGAVTPGEHTRIMVVRASGTWIGALVDEVQAVITLSKEALQPPPAAALGLTPQGTLSALAYAEDRLLLLLNASSLLILSDKNPAAKESPHA